MSCALNIILTKPKQNKYENLYFICTDIDECYNKIITTLKNIFKLEVDYPEDYIEFKNLIWYNAISFDNEVFEYSIFTENKWITPWSHQEIYENICTIINTNDLQNSIFNKKNRYDYVSDCSDTSDDEK
jgi:hypothetical protein